MDFNEEGVRSRWETGRGLDKKVCIELDIVNGKGQYIFLCYQVNKSTGVIELYGRHIPDVGVGWKNAAQRLAQKRINANDANVVSIASSHDREVVRAVFAPRSGFGIQHWQESVER